MLNYDQPISDGTANSTDESTRFWLGTKKSQILDCTHEIGLKVDACSHSLRGCACISEVRRNVNEILSVSSEIRPYLTNQQQADSLRVMGLRIVVIDLVLPSQVRGFCAAANSLDVNPTRNRGPRRWWSAIRFGMPTPWGLIGFFVKRETDP